MRGFNKVFLMGHIGQTPELKTSKNGHPYTQLSIATRRSIPDGDGQWKEKTEWHKVGVFGRKAELCSTYLTKGSGILVEATLSNYLETLEDGKAKKQVVITATDIEFLPKHSKLEDEQFTAS